MNCITFIEISTEVVIYKWEEKKQNIFQSPDVDVIVSKANFTDEFNWFLNNPLEGVMLGLANLAQIRAKFF